MFTEIAVVAYRVFVEWIDII